MNISWRGVARARIEVNTAARARVATKVGPVQPGRASFEVTAMGTGVNSPRRRDVTVDPSGGWLRNDREHRGKVFDCANDGRKRSWKKS